ncbi:MAG: VanZ family protein [Cytophagales bacterium]|nr:MAG: VanZ family protein [Cytophagales bacterium]
MKYWIIFWLWFLWIAYLCFMPSVPSPPAKIPHLDKIVHAFLFFILQGLALWAIVKNKQKLKLTVYLQYIIALLFYAIIIEIIQHYYIKGRSGDLLDVLADITGAILASFLFSKFIR